MEQEEEGRKVVRKFRRFIFKNTVALRIVCLSLTPAPPSVYNLSSYKSWGIIFTILKILQFLKKKKRKRKNRFQSFRFVSILSTFSFPSHEHTKDYIPLSLRVSFLWIISTLTTRCILVLSVPESRINALLARARTRTNSTTTLIKYVVYEHGVRTNVGGFCVQPSTSAMPFLNEANLGVAGVKRETRVGSLVPLQYGRFDWSWRNRSEDVWSTRDIEFFPLLREIAFSTNSSLLTMRFLPYKRLATIIFFSRILHFQRVNKSFRLYFVRRVKVSCNIICSTDKDVID